MGSAGNITSHLIGLPDRTSRLMGRTHINPIFVFDRKLPLQKELELSKRIEVRDRTEGARWLPQGLKNSWHNV